MNFRFFVVFCNHIKGTDMELVVQKNSTKTARTQAAKRKVQSVQTDMQKTPESELTSVEEYFGAVWNRYLEKYEKLQG